MAGRAKKHRLPNRIAGNRVKVPMVSLKVKKQKQRSRGK